MEQFINAKQGDKVWSIRHGWGTIINTNYTHSYPLIIEFLLGRYTFNKEGKENEADGLPTLFWDEIKFDIPDKPKRLVTKTITAYTNVYKNKDLSATQKLNEDVAMGYIYFTKYRAESNGSPTAISKGAKVTIEYQVEE